MTVKLLTSYGGQPQGTLYTSDANSEASMVAQGEATTNLSGASAWPPAPNPGVGPSASVLTPAQVAAMCKVPTLLPGSDFVSALLNSQAIQALLVAGAIVCLPANVGAVYSAQTLKIPSFSALVVPAGTWLKRPPGVYFYNLVRNLGSHGGAYVNGSTISNGLLTVSEPGHSYVPGQQVFCENWQGNPSLNGPQTVVSAVPGLTWTFAASGANPTNTSTQVVFTSNYNPVPGASFARVANSSAVTLNEGASATVTFTGGGSAYVHWVANGLPLNCPVVFTSTGTLPSGIVSGTTYYVSQTGTDYVTLGAAINGASITPSGTGSGTITGYRCDNALTWNAHGLAAEAPVFLQTTGALPAPLAANTVYYVSNPSLNGFQLSATPRGLPISWYGAQSGTQTAYSGTVTVTEPGHTRRTGNAVWVNGLGGANSFNQAAVISSTVEGVSWTYVNAGVSETATGTAQLLGDRQILIDGYFDGNSSNTPGAGINQWAAHVCQMFNISDWVGVIRESRDHLVGRAFNISNSTCGDFPPCRFRDGAAVGFQFDGLCDRMHVQSVDGQSMTDDMLAWGATDGRGGGLEADTTPPAMAVFGQGNMGELHVDCIQGASPTGVFKMFVAAGYDAGKVVVGPVTATGPLSIGDSTPGVSGGTFQSLTIGDIDLGIGIGGNTPRVSIGAINGQTNNLAFSGMGPIKLGRVTDNVVDLGANNGEEALFAVGPVSTLEFGPFIAQRPRTNSSAFKLQTTLLNCLVTVNGLDSVTANGGYTMLCRGGLPANLRIAKYWRHFGANNQAGTPIRGDTGGDWLNVWVDGADINGCNSIIDSETAGLTHKWFLRNINVINAGVGIVSNVAGTYKVFLENVYHEISNHLVQMQAAGQTVRVKGSNIDTPYPSNGILAPISGMALSVDGKDLQLDLGPNAGTTPAGMSPQAGDHVYNSNATGGGEYVRNAANTAWVIVG